jgi:hypothetical protein
MPFLSFLSLLKIISAVNLESMNKLIYEVTASKQITTTITKELVHLRASLKIPNNSSPYRGFVNAGDGQDRFARRTGSKIPRRRSVTTLYCGLLGKALIKRISQSTKFGYDGKSSIESGRDCERTWVFMPSFLSTCVEFQYISAFGSIQRSLRTYPLLRYDHPIWDMCEDGNLKGMQAILSEGQVSPFSVDSAGWTLLHVCCIIT